MLATQTPSSPDEELEFYSGANNERIRLTRQQTAVVMLMSRGNPQTIESLGVAKLIAEIEASFKHLKEQLNQFQDVYIAPEGIEAHRYNVKRRGKTFS